MQQPRSIVTQSQILAKGHTSPQCMQKNETQITALYQYLFAELSLNTNASPTDYSDQIRLQCSQVLHFHQLFTYRSDMN